MSSTRKINVLLSGYNPIVNLEDSNRDESASTEAVYHWNLFSGNHTFSIIPKELGLGKILTDTLGGCLETDQEKRPTAANVYQDMCCNFFEDLQDRRKLFIWFGKLDVLNSIVLKRKYDYER